jgi:heat shock protein HslJ
MQNRLTIILALALLGAMGCGTDEKKQETAETPAAGPKLAGTSWLVETVGGRAVLAETELTLRFGGNDQITGNAGCNSFHGEFRLSGESLSFGPLASTRKACPEGILDQEAGYLAALARTERVRIEGGKTLLLLPGEEGEPIRLRPAPEPSLGDKPGVEGMVIYAGSSALALPEEGGRLTVKLLNVSEAEGAGALVARTVRTVRSSPPFPFRVAYSPESIDNGASYALEAELEIGGRVRFRSPSRVPVLTHEAPRGNVEVPLEGVSGS